MGILRNVNFILDQARIPCAEPDSWLMIRTAFASAPPALLQLFVPGCSEILQARAGIDPFGGPFDPLLKGPLPKGPQPKRGRHGKQIGAPIKKLWFGTPQGGNQFLFKIGFFAVQRALWWWQVAEVTSEFFATWQSLIYEEQGCDLPDAGHYSAPWPPFVYTDTPTTAGLVPGFRPPCVGVTTNRIQFNPGCSGSIMWSTTWTGWPNPAGEVGNVNTWLENVDTSEVFAFARTNDPIQKNGNTTGGFHKHRGQGTVNPTFYRIMVDAEPAQTGCQGLGGQVQVTGSGFAHSSAFGCNPPHP